MAAATILDPRFKKNHFTDHEASSRAINRINTSISDITLPQNNIKEEDAIEGTDNGMNKGIWNFHKLLVKKQLSMCALAQESQGLNKDFKHYLSQAVVHLKYDPILYWQEQKISIYHHVISIVGSSVH